MPPDFYRKYGELYYQEDGQSYKAKIVELPRYQLHQIGTLSYAAGLQLFVDNGPSEAVANWDKAR